MATTAAFSTMPAVSPAPKTYDAHRARLNRFVSGGQTMAYVDTGPKEGKPIVLLHGMPTSSWLYRHVIPRLAEDGFRVIAPDMIGFGASSKPSDASHYQFATQAERLRALMSSLGIASWTQVVHDLGGPWTWELADRHPDALAGLVVMNTTAYRDGFAPPAMMKMAAGAMGGFMAFMMRNGVTGPGQIASLFKQMMAHPEKVTPEMIRGYALPMSEGTTHALLAFARGFDWWFEQFTRYQMALRRLDIPAGTIWGKRDKVLDVTKLPRAFAQDLRIPAQNQHVLDAGHFLQEDHPAEVAAILSRFMQAL